MSIIQKSSATDLFIATLIADIGIRRYEHLFEKFSEDLNLPDSAKLEIADVTQHCMNVLSEALDNAHTPEKKMDGGLGYSAIDALAKMGLSFSEDDENISAVNALHLVLLRNIPVGQLNEGLTFLGEKVSAKAGREARRSLRELSEELFSAVPSDEAFAEYLRDALEEDLRGPVLSEERKKNAERTDLKGGVLSILTTLLGVASGKDVKVENLLREYPELDPNNGANVGDTWRMMNIPWGLPADIENFLRRHDPRAEFINMDAVRSTPLYMLEREDGMDRMQKAMDNLQAAGRVNEQTGAVLVRLFLLVREQLVRDFGSVKQAREATVGWLAKAKSQEQKYAQPTPGCDCPRCKLVKSAGMLGFKVDVATGDLVRT